MAAENTTAPLGLIASRADYATDIAYTLSGAVLLFTSSVIATAILTRPALRERKELLFVTGLAIGDAAFGFALLSSAARRAHLKYEGRGGEKVGRFFCIGVVTTYAWFFTKFVRGAMMVVISLDRYLAIKYFTWRCASNQTYPKVVVWSVAAHTLVALLVGTAASYSERHVQVSILCFSYFAMPDWYNWYAIPFSIGTGCLSVLIYGAAFVAYRQTRIPPAQMDESTLRRLEMQQRRFTRTIGILVLFTLFGTCTNYTGTLNYYFFNKANAVLAYLQPYLSVADMVNSMVNIGVYYFRLPEVREAMLEVMRFRFKPAAVTYVQQPQPAVGAFHRRVQAAPPANLDVQQL